MAVCFFHPAGLLMRKIDSGGHGLNSSHWISAVQSLAAKSEENLSGVRKSAAREINYVIYAI